MKVIFIKDHPVGIKEGRIVSNDKETCKRWIKEGYAQEVEEEEKPKRGRKPKNKIELTDSFKTKNAE